jgi:hypothetical protein
MKHKKSVISIALATIMLVSLCTVVCSTSVTAADNSRKTAQAPATVGGVLDSTPAVAMWKVAGAGDNFIPGVAAKIRRVTNHISWMGYREFGWPSAGRRTKPPA